MSKAKAWTERELSFLQQNYLALSHREIGEHLGKSAKAVNSKCKKLKLHKPHFRFSGEQLADLQANYANIPASEFAAKFGCVLSSVHQKAAKLGLKKSLEFVVEFARKAMLDPNHRGRFSQFRKGVAPPNKGLRRPGWHRGRMKETQFKKGQISHNRVSVGTEIVNSDGYLKVKIAEPNIWKEKHILIWNEVAGKVPKGLCVVFKDGNKLNCVYENLELITRGELMKRNTIHNYPPELKETIQTLGALKRKLNRRIKKNAEK